MCNEPIWMFDIWDKQPDIARVEDKPNTLLYISHSLNLKRFQLGVYHLACKSVLHRHPTRLTKFGNVSVLHSNTHQIKSHYLYFFMSIAMCILVYMLNWCTEFWYHTCDQTHNVFYNPLAITTIYVPSFFSYNQTSSVWSLHRVIETL